MRTSIKELGDWIIDFEFQDACKLTDSGLFEYYGERTKEREKTLISFGNLPIRLQGYLKQRWPNQFNA